MATEVRPWARSVGDVTRKFRRLIRALQAILDVDRRLFETSASLDKLLVEILKGAYKLTSAKYAQILLRQGQDLVVAHSTDISHKNRRFPIDSCVCGIAVEQNRSVVSGDVQKDFGDLYKAMLGRGHGMRSEVVIPIRSPSPHAVIVGVLNVESPKAAAFDDGAVDIIEQFARQAGAAIHSARLREALQLTLELTKLNRGPAPHEAVRKILARLVQFFSQNVEIQFLTHEPDTGSLLIEYSTKADTEGVRVLVANSFSGRVVQNREPLLSNDVRVEYASYFQDTLGGTRSELAVPIFGGNGVVVGVLNVESSVPGAFTEHDVYLLSILAEAGAWHRMREVRRTHAEASMVAIGDVASNVLHILNNRLQPIKWQYSKVLSLAHKGEITADFTAQMNELTIMLTELSEAMQSVDEKYKNALQNNTTIDINAIVEEKRQMITRSDITFVADLDREMKSLQFPPSIGDVLWNLVSNASFAIPVDRPGEIIVRTKLIKGVYSGRPEALEIDVADNGIGMSREKSAKLFELGNGDRHGFGLWWVKSFVERCEGTIMVKSTPGEGTRFHLSFPLTADGAARAIETTEVTNASWTA